MSEIIVAGHKPLWTNIYGFKEYHFEIFIMSAEKKLIKLATTSAKHKPRKKSMFGSMMFQIHQRYHISVKPLKCHLVLHSTSGVTEALSRSISPPTL